jgi:hypothetical protein
LIGPTTTDALGRTRLALGTKRFAMTGSP